MVEKQAIPKHLKPAPNGPLTKGDNVLFRRVSGKVRITIFKGGHATLLDQAFRYLAPRTKILGSKEHKQKD